MLCHEESVLLKLSLFQLHKLNKIEVENDFCLLQVLFLFAIVLTY